MTRLGFNGYGNITSEFFQVAPPWGEVGQFFLGESQSRIYPHMRAKLVAVRRSCRKRRGYDYETSTSMHVYNTANNVSTFSMSGTILPTMCQMLVVIQ